MLADTRVNRREEQLVLREGNLGSVGAALQVDCLKVGTAVVEDDLGGKVEETSRLRAELIGDQREGFAFDQTERREGPKRVGGVLQDFEDAGSIAGVANAHSLVDTFIRSTGLEVDPVVAQFHHGDEGLRPWGKGVTAASHIDEERRVDFFVREVSVLAGLSGPEQSLVGAGSFCLVASGQRCLQLLVFEMVSIQKVNEALRYLEKVTVGLIRRKLSVELEAALGRDLLLGRFDAEGVLDVLARGLVVHIEKGPVHPDREVELILDCHGLGLADAPTVSKLEVDLLAAHLHISLGRGKRLQHLFV